MVRIAAALGVLVLGGALGAWFMRGRHEPAPPPVFAKAMTATQAKPWENSLGMKFVPLPEHPVLICIWETRLRDFKIFSEAEIALQPDWQSDAGSTRHQKLEKRKDADPSGADMREHLATWDAPGFPQTPDDPACGIDIGDARLFCSWLSWRERNEGRLTATQRYRLPSNDEWSDAVEQDNLRLLQDDKDALANFAGVEVHDAASWPADAAVLARRDPYARTAPVGSFKPNALGLYDMFGNVAEWVDTLKPHSVSESSAMLYGVFGGSWSTGTPFRGKAGYRNAMRAGRAQPNIGFRIVLDLEAKTTPRVLDPIGDEAR
jgi:formylglycine-generating enzyme required for sulfatase activity